MKYIITVLTVVLFAFTLQAQDRFGRSGVIPAAPDDIGGFGEIVTGVDFDNDGKPEVYAVNTVWFDQTGKDLVPRIYKYEQNESGEWEEVWSTRLPLIFQNTWPPLAATDLDNDGKFEISWSPANNLGGGLQPNPERIVVFETPGDGSDNMGVDNGDGTWSPNAHWTIRAEDNQELRPFKWIATDIDSDGKQELVAAVRRDDVDGFGMHIYSVDDVPDNGDGSETWTLEFAGLSGTHYDIGVIGNMAYGISSGGEITSVTATAPDTYVENATQATLLGKGSWNSATTVDVDNDGQEEILAASWNSADNDVYLLQQSGDTLTVTNIADVPASSFRSYGGEAGDVDGDGNVDFIFGTRSATPNGVIHRLEYQGGAIDDPNTWELSVIDSDRHPAVQYDMFGLSDVDGDGEDEIFYTGTARHAEPGKTQPISILTRIPANQPKVKRVTDVPNDQGRQVWVVWEGAADDVAADNGGTVAVFGPEGATLPQILHGGNILTPIFVDPSATAVGDAVISQYVVWRIDNGLPVQVAAVVPIQASVYAAVVSTLGDGEDWAATYVVSSHTADPLTNWKSFPNKGFSEDNLAPEAPTSLAASEGETAAEAPFVELTWDESLAEDFDFFTVVRGTSPGFDASTAEVIAELTGTSFTDENVNSGETFFYRVAASDFNGNLGDFSAEVSLLVTSVGGSESAIPQTFALSRNYPNPFNPTTQITYDLASATDVSLKIYNMRGQEIRTLVSEAKPAGSYTIQWNGTDNSGVQVASGIYVYLIKAGNFTKSYRMTLLK